MTWWLFKAIAIWLVIVIMAIANAVLREKILNPAIGSALALPLSGLLLSAIVFLIAFIGYPKNSSCRSIGLLMHDKINQFMKTGNAGALSAKAKDLGLLNIPGRYIRQSPLSFVFVFNAPVTISFRCGYGHQSTPGLYTGLFVRRNDKVITAQGLAFPNPW